MAIFHSLREIELLDRLDGLAFWKWLVIVAITAALASMAPVLGIEVSWLWWIAALEVAAFITIKITPRFTAVVELLAPMWMPLLVLVAAAYALFLTKQGRDLGVGLLDAGQGTLFLLAAALFYWATGTWHAARLGLKRAFGATREEWDVPYSKMWLRWLPRLLGACAHFYATITIALAARHVEAGSTWFELIYFAPSLLIAVGTGFLWWHDARYMDARDSQEALACAMAARDSQEELACANKDELFKEAKDKAEHARQRTMHAIWTLLGLGALTVAMLVAASQIELLEYGFVPATSWVLVSAALFLILVSQRARIGELLLPYFSEDRQKALEDSFIETREKLALSSKVLNAFLMSIAIALIAIAWINPLWLGNTLTSMVAGFSAFGVYIVIVNGVRMVAGSSWRFAGIAAFVLLLALGTSLVRNFHVIRLCDSPGTECTNTTDSIEARATVGEAAVAWYEQARKTSPEGKPVPMLIVATAGGGIRAAYWTATILERLEQELTPEVLRQHLFAISGVSGGSVGATAYAAAVKAGPDQVAQPTAYLEEDFLAPAITTLAFVDLPSTILPNLGAMNRATALERAFEAASEGLLAGPFLGFFPSADDLSREPWRPALLLNSAHQNTGRRVITSHLKVERRVFLNAFDAHHLLGADMPASTAAHNSARFTYISPAGRLLPQGEHSGDGRQGFLLDGGYFENYGAVTALQVLREARAAINEHRARTEVELPEVRPVVLQISSDPSLFARDRARINGAAGGICDPGAGYLEFEYSEPDGWFGWKERDSGGRFATLNELVAPIAGIMASRSAHGVLASEELARAICADRQLKSVPANGATPGDGLPVAEAVQLHDATSAIENPLVAVRAEPEASAPAPGSSSVAKPHPLALPVYAHLAMCEGEEAKLASDESGEGSEAIEPPLGWVLSPRLRPGFGALLGAACGNGAELGYLVEALR